MDFKRPPFNQNSLKNNVFAPDELVPITNRLSLIVLQIKNLEATNQPAFLKGKYYKLLKQRDRLIAIINGENEEDTEDYDDDVEPV